MIPILFPSTATNFTGRGQGLLSDAISCKVTEERNGAFELEMVYPVTGRHYAEILDRSIILAIPSPYRNAQPFRVYQMEQPINGVVTIKARHISYDLSGIPVTAFSTSSNVSAALSGLVSHAAVTCPFSVYTDKNTVAAFELATPSSFKAALGGSEGSILDVFGGEYLWDGYTINLLNSRGSVKDYKVQYAKNIVDFNRTSDMEKLVTGIYPFWSKEGDTRVCSPPVVEIYANAGYENVLTVDLTDKFDTKPSAADLQTAAQKYISDNALGMDEVSLNVSFVDLASIREYASRAQDLKIDLCDTVTVVYPMYGVETQAKIVRIEMNVLLDRYENITVGTQRTTTADTIASLEQTTQTLVRNSSGGGGSSFEFPVGSVVTTNTNTNPGTDLGGSWSLIDKEFKSQSRTATVTRNTTNFSALSVTALYNGHSITFVGSMTSRVNISNTNLEAMTQTLTNNGASALASALPFTGYCDNAHAMVLMDIDTAGRVRTLDVVIRGTGTSINSGNTFEWSVTCPCVYTAMQDSFCDKFFWKRTA